MKRELDNLQKRSVITGEVGILSKNGRGFHFPGAFARKNLYHLTWSDEFVCDERYKVDREFLPCYELMNLLEGRMEIRSGGAAWEASGGDLILLDLNKPHYYAALTRIRVQQYMFNGNALPAYFKLLADRKNGETVFHRDSRLSFLASSLKRETMEPIPDDHIISVLVAEILCALTKEQQGEDRDPVKQAKYFMADHYRENISLDDIAASVSLSKYYFSRLFEKEEGCTPWEFLTETRMINAMHMLTHGGFSVDVIGITCGFSSAAHFIRAFKKYTGMTPGTFRKHFFEVSMGIEKSRR